MKLTQFSDYALRTLIYVAVKKDKCTITEIAESYQISRNHLVKVVHKLGELGYLETLRGNKGGIKLNCPPETINIGKLIQQTEPDFNLVECFDVVNGKCCIIPVCKLKKILWEAKNDFINTLSQYTLKDLTINDVELADHLNITF